MFEGRIEIIFRDGGAIIDSTYYSIIHRTNDHLVLSVPQGAMKKTAVLELYENVGSLYAAKQILLY